MSTQASLRLVEPSGSDALMMDRRIQSRHALGGRVTAVRSTDITEPADKRICSLELLNMSSGGLGAVCQESVPIDTRITVFFPPHGPERGFDLNGRVVRCRPNADGRHDLGIRFDEQQQAA